MLKVSCFKNKVDNVPRPKNIEWQNVKVVQRKEKDGLLWSPAIYDGDATRSAKAVKEVTAFVMDVDGGSSPEDFEELWQGLARTVHSTFSHTKEKPKWRVIFPLAYPVPGKDWARVWQKLAAALGETSADPACKDASRMYYLPSCPPGAESFKHDFDGIALNPDRYPDIEPEPEPQQVSSGRKGTRPGDEWAATVTWYELLTDAGWILIYSRNGRGYWKRPGKAEKGISAVDNTSAGGLYVFSSNAPIAPGHYSKFAFLAHTKHHGDYSEAARALVAMGFGEKPNAPVEAEEAKSYDMTDGGNADRFVEKFGRDYLHTVFLKDGWLRFDSAGVWRHDPKSATRDARKVADAWKDDVRYALSEDHAKALKSWAKKSDSKRCIQDMLTLAAADVEIAAESLEFDRDPLLLSTPSGVVNLKTGEVRPADRSDLITKSTSAIYDPDADTSEWERFIFEIMDGDQEMAEYLQRCAGYSLTGENSAQAFFVLYGAGANGKSLFSDVISKAWGTYSKTTTPETWLLNHQRNKDLDMALLKGVRITFASEFRDGRSLDESLIKAVTGDGSVYARMHHAQGYDYTPTAKLWMATNHKPEVGGGAHGFWRRVKLIPFTRQFDQNREFAKKMMGQQSQALAWAVRGAMEWLQGNGGLSDPAAVVNAVEVYKADQDVIAEWRDEFVVIDPMESEEATALYSSYIEWCQTAKVKPMSKTAFGKKLNEQGFESRKGAKGKRYWDGLRLNADGLYD